MPLAMTQFAGMPAFLTDFSLQQNQGAALFARSPRTLRRWCRRGYVPQHALDLVRIIREQLAPLSASFARAQRASSSDWTARLAAPAPVSRRRRWLISIAEGYAANGETERAASVLREAWPTVNGLDCLRAAATMAARAEGRRAAAIERRQRERGARRAAYMSRYRRRRIDREKP